MKAVVLGRNTVEGEMKNENRNPRAERQRAKKKKKKRKNHVAWRVATI